MKKLFLDSKEPYLQIPSDSPPKYLLSLKNKETYLMGLNFYSALTPRSRLKKQVLVFSYGMLNLLLRTELIHVADDSTINRIRSILKNHIDESCLFNAYIPSSDKAVIQVIRPNGSCQKVIKAAFNEKQRPSLEKDKNNLIALTDYPFKSFEIPRVLDSCQVGDTFIVEYSCPEKYRPYERLYSSLELSWLLSEIFSFGRQKELPLSEAALFSEIKKRIELTEEGDMMWAFELWAKRLSSQKVPLGMVHYDFKPWNIVIDLITKRPFIVDWELMRSDGFPLWDAYCYILFTYFSLHCDAHPRAALRHFYDQKKFFMAYVKALNINSELIEKLLPLYFFDILTIDELWHRWDKNENRPQRIYLSMKRFLFYLYEHFPDLKDA